MAMLRRILAAEHPVGGPALGLALRGALPLGRWELGARLGLVNSLDSEVTVRLDDTSLSVDGESVSHLASLSLARRLGRHWALGLNLDHLRLNQSILGASLGVRYVP